MPPHEYDDQKMMMPVLMMMMTTTVEDNTVMMESIYLASQNDLSSHTKLLRIDSCI